MTSADAFQDDGCVVPAVDTVAHAGPNTRPLDGSDPLGPRTPAATLRARDVFTPAGIPMKRADGTPLATAHGDPFVAPFTRPVLDAGGRPVLSEDGTPGVTPLTLPVTDPDGHAVFDEAGKPLSGLVAKRSRRDEDPEIRRAWVTRLTARALSDLPPNKRTITEFEKRSVMIATLLGDPAAAFRRQDADRSELIGGIYRRARFGRTRRGGSTANAAASANWAVKLRAERKQRIQAEERATTLERNLAGGRLISAVELVLAAEARWGLSPTGKPPPKAARSAAA